MRLCIFFVLSLVFAIGCSSSRSTSLLVPRASVSDTMVKTYATDLVIHYKLYKGGITDTFNRTIAEALKGPFDFSAYGIEVALAKAGNATVELQGKSVLVIVPVAVQVIKKTFLTDLRAKGIMEMSFVSDVDVDSLWQVKTKTRLSAHKWTEKPTLTMAGFSMPIETISDAVVARSKGNIERSIDETVRESFSLRQKMWETMKMFHQPMVLDTAMNAWLLIKPERFMLNRITNGRQFATGKIGIKAKSTFTTTKPTVGTLAAGLPKVSWSEGVGDSSVFRLVADIRSAELTTSLQSALGGKTFQSDGKNVAVKRVTTEFTPQGMTISAQVSGSFTGIVIIHGMPKYDIEKNILHIAIQDVQVKTKNVLHRAAAWLGEGKIRSEMEKQMRFPIDEKLVEAQQSINARLLEFNKKYDLDMVIGLGKTTVESFEMRDGQLLAFVRCAFYLGVGIRDFRSFGKM
jgi:hypothetical protein